MNLDSKSLLEAVFESTAEGILIVDDTGKVIHSNSRFQEMWKIPDELMSTGDDQKLLQFILDQLLYPDTFLRKVQDLYLLPEAISEDTIAFKDGRYFARHSRPLISQGKNCGRVWTFLDISREKKNEEVFKAITELSPDIISILSPEGILTFNSAASERIHGYKRNSLVGKNTFEYIHPEDQAACQKAMENLFVAPGTIVTVQYRYRNLNGRYDWMEATACNQIANPLIQGLVAISREIGPRKKLEDDLQQAVSNLENFISIASHELKTPVTGIKLQLQMLERNRPSEKSRRSEDLGALIRQVNSLERLIDDLLNVSRIRRGKFTYEISQENLSLIVSQNIQRLESILSQSGCELTTKISPDIMVKCDRLRIEQVLINLISNIVRYAPGSPVSISLEKSGNFAELRVRDKGPGISPPKIEKIFLPFGAGPEKDAPGGLGVGLFISKTIIEHHGGELLVESTSHAGTTILMRLPVV